MRELNTGAVRDDATGKGRYDLMPWGAIHALAQHCEHGLEVRVVRERFKRVL